MDKKVRVFQWFIEPDRKTETNERLAEYLSQEGIAAESEGQVMFRGRRVNGWNVPYRIVTHLTNSAKVFPFKFRVYVKEGGGEWREYRHHRKPRVNIHSKKAQERLKEMGARK